MEGGVMTARKERIICSCCSRLLCYIYSQGPATLGREVEIRQGVSGVFLEIKCGKCGNIVKVLREQLLEKL